MSFGEIEFEKGKEIGLNIDHYGKEFDIYFRGDIAESDSLQIPLDIFRQIYWYIIHTAKYKYAPYSLINLILQFQNEKRLGFENNLFKNTQDENNLISLNLKHKKTFFKKVKYIEVKFKNKINSRFTEICLTFEEAILFLKIIMTEDSVFADQIQLQIKNELNNMGRVCLESKYNVEFRALIDAGS